MSSSTCNSSSSWVYMSDFIFQNPSHLFICILHYIDDERFSVSGRPITVIYASFTVLEFLYFGYWGFVAKYLPSGFMIWFISYVDSSCPTIFELYLLLLWLCPGLNGLLPSQRSSALTLLSPLLILLLLLPKILSCSYS